MHDRVSVGDERLPFPNDMVAYEEMRGNNLLNRVKESSVLRENMDL